MRLKPIRTEADYDAALEEIDRLMDATPGTPEGDQLDILATLVEAYEARHHPIEAPDPVAALEYFMEQRGVTRADLVPLLGSRSRVSEILNRKRRLTIDMAWRLHRELGIPAEAVIKPYKLADRL
ncbi:MAG: helix-turn-helix domain-containing protein [Geminicoccaceae bacterium]